jgi:hypothetical protein
VLAQCKATPDPEINPTDASTSDTKPDTIEQPIERKPADVQTNDNQPTERECVPGALRDCYTGPPQTDGIGPCTKGTQFCQQNGRWTNCINEITPSPEVCDKQDNDCDGQIDNGIGCDCQSGDIRPCGNDKGECKPGTQTCLNGQWGTCQGMVLPTPEICDNKDNDCDGQMDSGSDADKTLTRECYTGKQGTAGIGNCKPGRQTCERGVWGTCAGQIIPTTETCDQKDNDCDGSIDEGCQCTNGQTQACGSSTGTCKQGRRTCTNGQWGVCVGQTGPKTEVCDGLDNDCDGQVDEIGGAPCTKGQGACKSSGKLICDAASKQLVCDAPTIVPKTEVCDGKDNNCNGQVDDIPPGQTCRTGQTGACATGQPTCQGGISICTVVYKPSNPTEQCRNNKDDDCDGLIDEICGPLHSYIQVDTKGKTLFSRKLSSRSQSSSKYQVASSTGDCGQVPLFVTPLDRSGATSDIGCLTTAGTKNFVIRILNTSDRATTTSFQAIQPAKATGEIFGNVDDTSCLNKTGKQCAVSAAYGTATVYEQSIGNYEIKAAPCSNPNQPIFIQIIRTAGNDSIYFRTGVINGRCVVKLRDSEGDPVSSRFSFWLPNIKTNAYAHVDATSLKTIAANTFNDQKAKWTISRTGTLGTEVTFSSWQGPSMILYSNTSIGVIPDVEAEIDTNDIDILLKKIPTGMTSITFSILFVQ